MRSSIEPVAGRFPDPKSFEQGFSQLRVVLVASWGMNTHLPLEIVWSRASGGRIRAEWAVITLGITDKSVSYSHIILCFEPFATFAPRVADVWTIMWPCRVVNFYVCV